MEGDDVAPTSTRVSPAKSASNPNGAKSKKHDCGFCGRSFARFEHLQRHEKIHTNEKPFTCLQCPKSFARKDLLVRHRKVIHEATESAQPQFQGSKYPLPEAPADAQALRQSRTRQIKKARLVLDGPSTTDLGIDISEEDQNHFQAEGGAVPSLGQPELHPFEGVSQDCAHPTQPNVPADPNALEEIAVHSLEPSGYSVLNHDDNTPESSGEGLFNSIWDAQLFDLPWLDSFDLSMTAFPSAVHTAQPLWPMPHNSPAPFSQGRQRQQQRQRPNADSIAENVDQTLSAPSSQSNPKNPAHGRPFAPSLHSRIFSRRPSPEPQKSLPISPLTPRTSSRIATKVRIRLNGQLEPLLPLLPSGFVLPSQYALGRYVSSYFDGFHLHLPLLHVPTWSPESCHVGLLIAMCALGAKYSFEKDIAMALWKAGRLVVRMATEERREILEEHRSVDMEICQAMLLLMAFQTWTGDKFLLRQAFSFQSTLANLVRQDSPKSPSQLEEMSWEEWIDYEGSKRTKLVIYCFFNLQYLTYNVPPLLLNREIALDLPSDEESWRAEDENLWRQNGRGQVSGTPPFQVALRKLLLESGSSSGTRSFQDPPPPPQDTSPYSTFGSYVLIHGLIQHHFQLRQYSGFTLAADSTLPLHQVRPIEHGLRSWQQAWEKSPEASLDPRNPHGPVAFNCTALLRMAYIRLEIDFGPACTALQSGDPHAIARAIRDQCTVSRGPRLTRAALHSCHALLILVKEGIDLVAHTQVFVWSIVHSVASFHCCLVLVKWLDAVTANAPDQPLSEEEKWLVKLVQETLQECNTGEVWDVKTLSVSVLRAWAKVFNGTTIWGIMPAMGEAFKIYANMLSGSELTDPGL